MKKPLASILTTLLFLSSPSEAQVIKKALPNNEVELQSDEADYFEEGAEYVAMDKNGKKKALIVVDFVDEDTASGKVLKGKAQKGFTLTPRDSGGSKRKKSSSSKKGFAWGAGARFASVSQTVQGVTVPNGLGGTTTTPSSTATASGFVGHLEGLYALTPEIQVGGTFKYAMLSSSGGGSTTIMDIGAVGKYNISEISVFAGFAPITNVSGGSSSVSGTTLTFGAGYRLNPLWEAVFEYRTISVSGGSMQGLNFGATYFF